jgi:hypothetical protein
MPARSLTALMTGLIDYAGLYPPAKLPMDRAVDSYATYLRSPEAWMLGRFICPVSRLEEFRREARGMLPRTELPQAAAPAASAQNGVKAGPLAPPQPPQPPHPPSTPSPPPGAGPKLEAWEEPWRISAIIDGDLDENLDAIFAFNHEHEKPASGLANIDAIEVKAADGAAIDSALDIIPEELYPFFEIPLTGDVRGLVASLAGADAAAKIRTGGVTPEAFPAPEAVAEFLVAASAADVTAGLHHALRGEYTLTYEPGCPRAVMHGFVGVFLGAALARAARAGADEVREILLETGPDRFRFPEQGASWRDRRISVEDLEATRTSFALSFGSCSFEEPVEELKGLGWL